MSASGQWAGQVGNLTPGAAPVMVSSPGLCLSRIMPALINFTPEQLGHKEVGSGMGRKECPGSLL